MYGTVLVPGMSGMEFVGVRKMEVRSVRSSNALMDSGRIFASQSSALCTQFHIFLSIILDVATTVQIQYNTLILALVETERERENHDG